MREKKLRRRIANLISGGDYFRLMSSYQSLLSFTRHRTDELIETGKALAEHKDKVIQMGLQMSSLQIENRELLNELNALKKHDEETYTWEDQPRDEHGRFMARQEEPDV